VTEVGGDVSLHELTTIGDRGGVSAPFDVPPPVVVLAPARSCSSVFVAMLGCHPELYGFPELKLFAHDTMGELLEAPVRLPSLQPRNHPPSYPASGLRRAVEELIFGGHDRAKLVRAGRWLTDRRDVPTKDVFILLLRRVAPLAGVEKSPETTFDEAGPRRALAWFPSSRFIHLVRHPVSFQQSLQKTPEQARALSVRGRASVVPRCSAQVDERRGGRRVREELP
jgi:Sulfotransferase family